MNDPLSLSLSHDTTRIPRFSPLPLHRPLLVTRSVDTIYEQVIFLSLSLSHVFFPHTKQQVFPRDTTGPSLESRFRSHSSSSSTSRHHRRTSNASADSPSPSSSSSSHAPSRERSLHRRSRSRGSGGPMRHVVPQREKIVEFTKFQWFWAWFQVHIPLRCLCFCVCVYRVVCVCVRPEN